MAVVRRLPASDPEAFSDSPKAIRLSPLAIGGRYFSFCSSVPPRMIGKRAEGIDGKGDPDTATGARELFDDQAQIEDAGVVAAVLLRNPRPGELVGLESLEDVPAVLAGPVELCGSRPHVLFRHLTRPFLIVDIFGCSTARRMLASRCLVRCILHPRFKFRPAAAASADRPKFDRSANIFARRT